MRSRKRGGSLAPFRQLPDDAVVAAVAAGRTLHDVASAFGVSAERGRQLARARGAPALAAD